MATGAPHRQLLREFIRSGSQLPRSARAPLTSQFRNIIAKDNLSSKDAENAALFLKSQRLYNTLLDRYNPLHNLTSEEHLKATANRVGLNMPVEGKDSEN